MPRDIKRHVATCSVHGCKFDARLPKELHASDERALREAIAHAIAQHVGTKPVTVRRTYAIASEEVVAE